MACNTVCKGHLPDLSMMEFQKQYLLRKWQILQEGPQVIWEIPLQTLQPPPTIHPIWVDLGCSAARCTQPYLVHQSVEVAVLQGETEPITHHLLNLIPLHLHLRLPLQVPILMNEVYNSISNNSSSI